MICLAYSGQVHHADERRRIRLPVTAKMALVNAGATGGTLGSPTPVGLCSLGTMWTSISGDSNMRSMRIVVEIVLLDAAVFQGDFGFERGSEAEDDAAFHLRFDDVRIYGASAIHGADDSMDADGAVFLDGGFDDLGDVSIEGKVGGDAATASGRRGLPHPAFSATRFRTANMRG